MKKQQKDKKVKKDRREKLRYIREVSAEQRGRILLSCLTGILGVAFALAFIYATKRVIDTATGITDDNLTHVAVLTVVLLTAQLLCGAADTWISTRMQIETGNALRHRLFSRLLQSRWNELERFHTGDVVNRVEQDTAAIVTLLTSSVPAFIVTSIQLLAAFLFFYFLDPSLPWLIVAILPVFLLGSRFYMRRMKRYTHDIRNSDGRIQSVIQESLQHRIVIKTLEQGERHLDKLDDLQDMLHSQVMGRTRFSLSAHMLVALAFSGGYLTAFLWGAVHLSAGCITFGTMTAFLQLVGKVQRPVGFSCGFVPRSQGCPKVKKIVASDLLEELVVDISKFTASGINVSLKSLRKVVFSGTENMTAFPGDINFSKTNLSVAAVTEMFNSLPDISGGTARTIKLAITPATAVGIPEATLAVATNKGWTVVTA